MYHVILTFSELPDPRRPFQALLIVCTKLSAKLGFLVALFHAREDDPGSESGTDTSEVSESEYDLEERRVETLTDSQPSLS